MRRIALIALSLLLGAAVLASSAEGENEFTYYIEADNAFGLVDGAEVKISGVPQGTVEELLINDEKRAVIKASVSGPLAQLGEDSVCSFQPQSLIAEYFVDCASKGDALEENEGSQEERVENPDIPVEQTRQTVQQDLVQSGLRQSYAQRLQLIINEFGTALAGNPENLNAAIRRGAPTLRATKQVTNVLAGQNRIISNLNLNSDKIFAELAANRQDVRGFVLEARDAAAASAERRDDLSGTFARLDDFLVELRPTMARLNDLAVTQTPLLRNLRDAAPGLTTLSENLPAFNRATTTSLTTLGDAAVVGDRALRKGRDEINQLNRSTKRTFSVADNLSKFLRDIDDPSRAVAEDTRARQDTKRNSGGYTGMEALLNYVYYQAGAINQFDSISHLLHFSIFEVGEGPCSAYNAGPTVPAAGGGETTDFDEIDRCVAWLGPNQPGINQNVNVPPYDPSACPEGSSDPELCSPAGGSSPVSSKDGKGKGKGEKAAAASGAGDQQPQGELPGDLGEAVDPAASPEGAAAPRGGKQNGGGSSAAGANDLMGFLLDD